MRFPLVRRWLTLVALALTVVLFSAGMSPSIPAAADGPPRPVMTLTAVFTVEPPLTSPFEAVQMVVDFPAGSRVGRHTHGGPGHITMLQNELTMWIGAEPMRTYRERESFVEPFRLVAEGANLGPEPSSVLVTYLLPIGAPVTTLEQAGAPAAPAAGTSGQLPPGASPRFESRMRIEQVLNADLMLSQGLRTYAPGASTLSFAPLNWKTLLTVVEGEVTVLIGTDEHTYQQGEHWIEVVGEAALSMNQGSKPAVVAVSSLYVE
jgi:quercetin dioxygenase-like cupin family protein